MPRSNFPFESFTKELQYPANSEPSCAHASQRIEVEVINILTDDLFLGIRGMSFLAWANKKIHIPQQPM